MAGMGTDAAQGIGLHGNGVARGEKERADSAAVKYPGFIQIGNYIRHRSHPVSGAVLVDHAEGAAIVGATDGGLNQQGIGLTGGTIDGTFVVHG
jgi:hypothetical protein